MKPIRCHNPLSRTAAHAFVGGIGPALLITALHGPAPSPQSQAAGVPSVLHTDLNGVQTEDFGRAAPPRYPGQQGVVG